MQMQSNLSSFSWFARKRLAQERWGGIGPLLARAGRREDYRNRDEWGYPTAPNASWQDRIGALMPVSYSGIILLICILVFLLSLVARGFVYDYLVLIPHFVVERPWTILTHMFVHFSFDHLFFNMLFLFFFGMELERRVGGRKFLQIYILSGIVAALAQTVVTSGSMVGMVGASGALFGALGCLAIIAPEIRVLLFFVIPMSIRWAVVVFALIDFTFMDSADNIGHMAHIAGLFVGLAFGQMMRSQPQYYYR